MASNNNISTLEDILAPEREQELIKSEAKWTADIKKSSSQFLKKTGFPTLKSEDWKYTDISQIYKYNLIPDKPETFLSIEEISNLLPKRILSINLVFINGFFMPDLSKLEDLPTGISVKNISQSIKEKDPLLEKYITSSTLFLENSFVHLNNLFLENGLFIHIDENIALESPIHIIYLNTEEKDFSTQNPRNLIIAENGAKVSILEEFHGRNSKPNFINHVTEILADKNAEVSHYLLQNESNETFQVSTLSVIQEESSKFSSQVISLGGKLTRNNIHSKLIGENASCLINGVYIINKKQHLDNFTSIDHISPNCTSSQLYHGILSDSSRGVFTGRINVHKNAHSTISNQTNRSLMLSEESHVDAKPQLEIFNEDVKCSHAATIGQLDEESMYYLRSRGIAHKDARQMLTLAFAHKITQKFENKSIRKKIEELIVKKMDDLQEAG